MGCTIFDCLFHSIASAFRNIRLFSFLQGGINVCAIDGGSDTRSTYIDRVLKRYERCTSTIHTQVGIVDLNLRS
jgi:hypothetical protein